MNHADAGVTGGSSTFGQGLRAAALYAALLLLMAYPLSLHPASMTAPGDPDTDLFMWTLAWNTHALFTAPWSIFDANIYYPHRHTLAFSENLIGNTLFAAPVLWASGSHVLALNAVSFASVVLCGLGAWLLARRLGASAPAAALAGLVFAYSPARFLRFGQLHLTTIHWMPFSLAFLHAYFRSGRKRDLRLAVAFFALQVLTSGHGATFLTVAIVLMLGYRLALGEPLAARRRLRDLGIPGLLMFALVLLVFVPYREVQLEHHLRRDLLNWAPSPESFIASPSIFHIWLLSRISAADTVVERASAWLFPGFLPLLLAAAALVPWWRARFGDAASLRWRRAAANALTLAAMAAVGVALWASLSGPVRVSAGDVVLLSARSASRAWMVVGALLALRLALQGPAAPIRGDHGVPPSRIRERIGRWREAPVPLYALLLAASILFAAGPPIGVWPLVYDLPGFNFIRVPSRFVLLGTLALGILAAFGFDRLAANLSARGRRVAAAALGVLMVLEFLTIPLPAARHTRVEIPPVDRWLAAQPKPFAVVEVPTNTYERLQSIYMLHSMAHWQKTVNGHSGIRSALHTELFDQLIRFPDPDVLRRLVELGVTFVVVHPSLYDTHAWSRVDAALRRQADLLELVYEESGDRVYRLRRERDLASDH